jgi:hypothetical protein
MWDFIVDRESVFHGLHPGICGRFFSRLRLCLRLTQIGAPPTKSDTSAGLLQNGLEIAQSTEVYEIIESKAFRPITNHPLVTGDIGGTSAMISNNWVNKTNTSN